MNLNSHVPRRRSRSRASNFAHIQACPFPSPLLPPLRPHGESVAMDIGGVGYRGHQIDGVKILQAANDLLLFRRHEEVLRVCKLGLDRSQDVVFSGLPTEEEMEEGAAKQGVGESGVAGDVDPSMDIEGGGDPNVRQMHSDVTREYRESVCVLAMQAYAELDRWDQVLPFLLSCYGEISKLPPRIVLMCILLFSKVRSFAEAESFSTQWLRAQNGWSMNQYCGVLELYIRRVFVLQGRWAEAREYVEANAVLSPERKMRYLKQLTELQKQTGDVGCDEGCETGQKHTGNILLNLLHKLRNLFSSCVSPSKGGSIHRIQNLAIISVFLYLLLFRSNTSIPTGASQASAIWNSIISVWRSLFAPFHVMAQEA